MSVEITLNWEAFERSAERLLEHSSRTMPEFINGQGLAVASRAIKHTEKANADQIAAMLGQVGTKVVRSRKTGKLRKGARVYSAEENTFAARIINKRRHDAGQKPLSGPFLADAVRKMINARVRSVSFIKSGWVWAVRELSKAVGYRPKGATGAGDATRAKGAAKGYAKPATFTLSGPVVCEIGNSSLIEVSRLNPSHHSNPTPIAAKGLQMALDETAADMAQELARRMQPIFDTPH
jgi:hypothetical protein